MRHRLEFDVTVIEDDFRLSKTMTVETGEHYRAGPTIVLSLDGSKLVELYRDDATKLADVLRFLAGERA